MITLGESITLSAGLDSCFSVVPSVQLLPFNRLLVTEGFHLAAVYDLSSSIPFKSWTFPGLLPLSAPVVYDAIKDRFVSLQSKTILKIFSLDDELEEVQAINLLSPAVCVVSNEKGKMIIVYENGHLETIGGKYKPRVTNDVDKVLQASEAFVSVQLDYSNEKPFLFVVTRIDDAMKIYRNSIENIPKKAFLQMQCYCTLKKRFRKISSFYEDSCLGLMPNGAIVRVKEGSENAVVALPTEYSETVSDMLYLDTDLVLITKQTNAVNQSLEIWDLKFGVRIKEISLELTPLEKCLASVNNNLVIACTKGVMIIPYEVAKPSLAGVLGSAVPSENVDHITTQETNLGKILNDVCASGPKNTAKLQTRALKIAAELGDNITNDDKDVLQQILSRPFIYYLAVNNLRETNFSVDEVVETIEIIKSLFTVKNLQIIDWICAFLDSYMKRLMLGSSNKLVSCLTSLAEWNNGLEEMCQYFENINIYVGRLHQRLERNRRKRLNNSSALYCIEYLEWE